MNGVETRLYILSVGVVLMLIRGTTFSMRGFIAAFVVWNILQPIFRVMAKRDPHMSAVLVQEALEPVERTAQPDLTMLVAERPQDILPRRRKWVAL